MKLECCQSTQKMDKFCLVPCRACRRDYHRACYDVPSSMVVQSILCLECRVPMANAFLRVDRLLSDSKKVTLSRQAPRHQVPFRCDPSLLQAIGRQSRKSGTLGDLYTTVCVVATLIKLPKNQLYRGYETKCYTTHINRQDVDMPQHTPLVIRGLHGQNNRLTNQIDIFGPDNTVTLEMLADSSENTI